MRREYRISTIWIQHCPRWVLISVDIRLEPVHIKPRWLKYEVERRFQTVRMIGLMLWLWRPVGAAEAPRSKSGNWYQGRSHHRTPVTANGNPDLGNRCRDVPYSFELTSIDDDTVGIWNAEASGYIVETNLIVTNRTKTFIFPESGSQKFYLQNPASDVPSPFTFKVSIR